MGGQRGAGDPYWVPTGDETTAYTVVMNGPQFAAFQAWLREEGLYAEGVPEGYELYSVRVRRNVSDSDPG